ncbi:MAG: hypothetical protein ACOX87_11570 [Chloroflexota bacterium]|jgi:hypothetical protein
MAKVATTGLTLTNVPFGEAVTVGELVGWSDNRLVLANGAVGSVVPAVGIAAATYKEDELGAIHLLGEISGFSGLTVGSTLYLSLDFPGTVQETEPTGPGNLKQVVGFAVAPDRIAFVPEGMGTVL